MFNMMSAPVGEFATGVLVPPAKFVVTSLFDVVHFGSLTKPHVPIEFRWGRGFRERTTDRTAINPDSDLADVTQQSLLDHVDRTQETVPVATLLSANEKDLVRILLASVANQLVFFQRQRQWLLAKDMLACL